MKSLYLSIDMGDMIYSLLFAKILGYHKVYIDGNCDHIKFNWEKADFLIPLIESQPYIHELEKYSGQEYDCHYGIHPQNIPVVVGTNLTKFHASKFGLENSNLIHKPWLTSETISSSKKVVINRTPRYHGNHSFYFDFLKYFNVEDVIFVGLEEEYKEFCQLINCKIDYAQVESALELAKIINSVPIFLGNQSLACAIATGLDKQCFIEYCPRAANYIFDRQNIRYF